MFDLQSIEEDHYLTLTESSYGEYKEKGSKFLAYAAPVSTFEECTNFLNELKKEHHSARHHCYAYRMQPQDPLWRANDDGEPSNSAGMPIYNQILSRNLWNTMVVVVRYFGGTKLGVSGLINAYKTSAAKALEAGSCHTEFITTEFTIEFPYQLINEVMRLIKELEIQIVDEKMSSRAAYRLSVRESGYQHVVEKFAPLHSIKIHKLTP